jgi:hypothetical protein
VTIFYNSLPGGDILYILWTYPEADHKTLQEDVMKLHVAMLGAGLLLAAYGASAGDMTRNEKAYFGGVANGPGATIESITKNYGVCLRSSTEGVVQSALAHVAYMKLTRPDLDLTGLEVEINRLAVFGPTQEVRINAHLVSLVFDSPKVFKALDLAGIDSPNTLFAAIAGRVQQTLMTERYRKYVVAE